MFVGLRDLWFARGRFALMTGVIALVAFLVVFLSGLTAGLGAETTSAIAKLDGTHVVFRDDPDGISYEHSVVDAKSAEQWVARPSVRSATPLGIVRGILTSGDTEKSVAIFAGVPDSPLTPVQIPADGGVLISDELARTSGLEDGDVVTIAGQPLTVHVGDVSGKFSHQPVVWTDLATWQELVHKPGAASVIVLDADPGVTAAAVDGTVVTSIGDSLSAIGGFSEEQGSLGLMQAFLMVISALVIGAFFTVWTMQRHRDIAVLKAMGASTRYLLGDAIGQAAIVLGIAAVLGGAAGLVAGALISGTVPFLSTTQTVLYPLILMSVLGLIGAGLALRPIVKVDPLIALGGSQ